MKSVICVLNSKYVHASLSPWCLKAGIREYSKENIECEVIESTINGTLDVPLKDIMNTNPTIVGFSCYIWNIEKTLQLARLTKKNLKNTVIVLGGPEVAYCQEKILTENSFVDYVMSGEGELPFAILCDSIAKYEKDISKDIYLKYGISFIKNGKAVIAEPYVTDAEPPTPYCDEFFKRLNGRICYIESSRGCPFRCAFCLSGRCGTVRTFGLERIKNEIKLLGTSGSKTIKFVDRTFNADKKRALEIFKFIIDNQKDFNYGVCFHFEIAGDLLTDEIISLLSTAPKGLIQLEIGLQSFNSKTLCDINRKTDIIRLKSNINKLLTPRNIHIHIDLIVGLPKEDIISFKKSFNTAFYLHADMLQFGFLKMLYGADMREYPQKYPCTFTNTPPYEVTSTPFITKEEMQKLKNTEDAFSRICNSGRFTFTIRYLTEKEAFDPFTLFYDIGNTLTDNENISLNEYFSKLFNYLCEYKQTDIDILRDVMAADKLLCDKSGVIPENLQVTDSRLKLIKRQFSKKNTKTCAVILYTEYANSLICGTTEQAAVVTDYSDYDIITGRFSYSIVKLCDYQ